MKNRDMKELREKCIEMEKLQKKENVKTWEEMFKKFAEEIEKNKEIDEIKRKIRQSMIGGMGSFNDLVLPDNEADKKLKNLRKELFELSI